MDVAREPLTNTKASNLMKSRHSDMQISQVEHFITSSNNCKQTNAMYVCMCVCARLS